MCTQFMGRQRYLIFHLVHKSAFLHLLFVVEEANLVIKFADLHRGDEGCSEEKSTLYQRWKEKMWHGQRYRVHKIQ